MPSHVSALSRLVPGYLRLTRANSAFVSARRAEAHIARRSIRPRPYGPPRHLRRDVSISVEQTGGWPVFTLAPATRTSRGSVVYVHGGGWVNEIAPQHWQLAAQIAAEAGTTVLLPIYPLVPFGTAEHVVAAIADLVVAATAAHGSAGLAGDSAGGQIALSAALVLREEHRLIVPRTVLISPALDLSMTNPGIDVVQPSDPWLGRNGTRVFIEQWRGGLAIGDPRVSPLAADLHGLGPLTVFCGTRDILNPDARLLTARAASGGVEVDYHEAQGLVHVYPLTPTPEGRAARALIVGALRPTPLAPSAGRAAP